jgi:hypothetical protein
MTRSRGNRRPDFLRHAKTPSGTVDAGRTPLLPGACTGLARGPGCERMIHADDALECGTVAFSIFAQVSRIETVRLKTNPEGEASASTQK